MNKGLKPSPMVGNSAEIPCKRNTDLMNKGLKLC